MAIKENIIFKNPLKKLDLLYLHPALLMVVGVMQHRFHEAGFPYVVTSAIRSELEDRALNAKSKTHREGRAVDVSVRGIDVFWLKDLIDELEFTFSNVAAVSASTGKPRLIYWHNNGNGDHLHIQVRR